MAKIDLIIPAYNAHTTLDRALGSVLTQTLLGDVVVTIVDDCSPNGGYDDFVSRYKDIMNIQCLRTPQNGGPGVAREYGVINTSCDYIIFMDADDTLANAYSLEMLDRPLDADEDTCMVVSTFMEETEDEFIPHSFEMTWLHGKMYRRSFWKKYDVHFHPTSRANEDVGVNSYIRLIVPYANARIAQIKDTTYFWHHVDSSITRINDNSYLFGASFPGYVDNAIYAYQKAHKFIGRYSENMFNFAAQIMCYLFAYYCETVQYANDRAECNFMAAKQFYDVVYSNVRELIDFDLFSSVYVSTMSAAYKNFPNLVPTTTIFQFIHDMKGDKNDI